MSIKVIKFDKLILEDICMPPFLGTNNCDDIGTLLKIIIDRKPELIFGELVPQRLFGHSYLT